MKDFTKNTRRHLLALLSVDAAATVVAVAATGALGFSALDAIGVLVAAGAAVTSFPAARRRLLAPAPNDPATPSARLDRTKKILVLAMLVGAIAYVGGRGTFAIFTAETGNSGNSMGSGTLVLNDKVGATSCWSYGGALNDNVNTACQPLLSPGNMAPGVSAAQTSLTIQNGGSLDAGTFYVAAPWPRATLGTALTSGVAPTQLSLSSGLDVALASGDQVSVTSAGFSQTFTVAAAGAAKGATVIPLSGAPAANYSYPVNSRVEDQSGNAAARTGAAANTDCYDTVSASIPAVPGATPGTTLPFVSATGNPLCNAVIFWIQEQTNGVNYCWAGRGAVDSPSPSTVGQCRTPTTAALSSGVTAGTPITTLNVSALGGNVKAGDTLTITEGTHQDTITTDATNGNAYINGTSVAINSWSPSYGYTTAAVIKDTSAFDALNGDFTDTLTHFDTFHKVSAPITLYPLTSNTAAPDSAATVSLGKFGTSGNAGYQRVFYIGVYLPAWSGLPQNQLQGLISTFGLNWHIQQ